MGTKAEYLQELVQQYIETGNTWPAPMHDVAKWVIRRNLWKPPPGLVETKCAEELSEALREEFAYDPQGRKIRTKHAAINPLHPEQGVLWDDIRTASEQHMRLAFDMRRSQIIGDCRQLRLDIDSFNENRADLREPIQMSFDFTDELYYGKHNKNDPKHSIFATH